MKIECLIRRYFTQTATLALLGGLGFLLGCASDSQPSASSEAKPAAKTGDKAGPPLPPGVTLHKEQTNNIQGVWVAGGFKFKGYQALYIAPPVFAAVERPNEVDLRAMAMQALPAALQSYLADTKLFGTVTTNAQDLKADGRNLKLQTTITEFEQGSNVGRAFGGVFGAGQPVIKVRGQLMDGEKPVCVFDVRRSGESDEDKFLGAGKSHDEIQRNDIRVLARDLAEFFKRTAATP